MEEEATRMDMLSYAEYMLSSIYINNYDYGKTFCPTPSQSIAAG